MPELCEGPSSIHSTKDHKLSQKGVRSNSPPVSVALHGPVATISSIRQELAGGEGK